MAIAIVVILILAFVYTVRSIYFYHSTVTSYNQKQAHQQRIEEIGKRSNLLSVERFSVFD